MISSPPVSRPVPLTPPREHAPLERREPVHVAGSLDDDFGRNPVARAYRRGAPDRHAGARASRAAPFSTGSCSQPCSSWWPAPWAGSCSP